MPNNLADWLVYLETLHHNNCDTGLERVAIVAKRFNILPFSCPVISVAGTNGKGSCVMLLESILLAQDYHVGSYTSPHLIRYNERVHINGQAVADEVLCEAFNLIDKTRSDILLNYFEFSTLAALLIFKQANLNAVILEVGIGGRLDPVNIVDADIAIISTIALDHMECLGTDRESIGFEKAGIMRAGRACVCGDFAVPESVRNYAKKIGAILYCQNNDFGYKKENGYWSWWSKQHQIERLPVPMIELQNAATVLKVVELLPAIDRVKSITCASHAIEQGLKNVFLPGRFQIVKHKNMQIIFDVAHNPAAAQLLSKKLYETSCSGKTFAVLGMLADKDVAGTVACLLEQVSDWYVGGLTGPRGSTANNLAECLRKASARKIQTYETITDAYRAALAQATIHDRIIVFGSFYTVAEIWRSMILS